jgi:hypothetical protein
MKHQLVVPGCLAVLGIALGPALGIAPALADDRPVTADERAKLVAAIAAVGCEELDD